MHEPSREESLHPFLWRFWNRTPTNGRIAIFDRSWNQRVFTERVETPVKGRHLRQAFEDVRSFERQLTVEGARRETVYGESRTHLGEGRDLRVVGARA